MQVLRVEEAQRYDREAVEIYGIPLILLMENAGAAVVKGLETLSDGIQKEQPYVFVLGTGHNGADGLVAARHLLERGAEVAIFIHGKPETASELFDLQYTMITKLEAPVFWGEGECLVEKLGTLLADAAVVIEGLVGTGLQGALRPEIVTVLRALRNIKAPILAIDVPAGLHADTGAVAEGILPTTITVTMGAPKVGLYLYPGKRYTGIIQTYSIGGPAVSSVCREDVTLLATVPWMQSLLPQRDACAHKGTQGHVLVIGGTPGLLGAPLLASLGAIEAGAGKISVATHEEAYDAMLLKAPLEVMVRCLPEQGEAPTVESGYRSLCADKDVVAIGPGLGRGEDSLARVERVLRTYEGPMVLDADALYVLGRHWETVAHREWPAVLTPHVGEFSHMTGVTAKAIEANRVGVARTFAKQHGVVLVLKGAPTVTAWPDGTVVINSTGNPGMATGGMGDVLTGIIAALLGQGMSPEEAATLGVYMHGASADGLAKEEPWGFTASEVAKGLSMIWKEL